MLVLILIGFLVLIVIGLSILENREKRKLEKKVLEAFNNGEQVSFINFRSNTFEKNISKESGFIIVKAKDGFLYFVGKDKVMYLYDCTLEGE